MNFKQAVITCLFEKYFRFSGRASRSEFWWFYLFYFIVVVLMQIVMSATAALVQSRHVEPTVLWWETGLIFLCTLLLMAPLIAAGGRRLQDVGRNGCTQLIAFSPVFGWVLLLYFWVQPSGIGANAYGPAPEFLNIQEQPA